MHMSFVTLLRSLSPDVNVLRIVIDEAKASNTETRELEVGDVRLSELRPIVSNDTCYRYEVFFGSYVAYNIRNESYVVMDNGEMFRGRLFNVYSRSHFLDYVRGSTIASNVYPGPFAHHGTVSIT